MPSRGRFVETLKKCVRARGLTYADLGRALKLSEPSIKRLFSRGSFTLHRIEEILALLELDLYDVARMSRGEGSGPVELSLEQETALAKDERLLSVFWLVLNDWRFADVVETFSISKAELTLAIACLARLRLVDWGPRERLRMRVPKDFQWRPGGPVKKAYGLRVTQEFLRARFDETLELLRFETRLLSPASASVIRRKLERLATECNELAEVDSTMEARKRIGFAVLLACRPWEFSVVNALKRRRSA